MKAMKRAHTKTPMSLGMILNLASLGFLAVAGLFLNFAIARYYGEEALGLFNMAFAVYIFASQFGSLGIHFSVLQSVSAFDTADQAVVDRAVTSGIVGTLITSTAAVFLCLPLVPLLGYVYGDRAEGIGDAVLAILPGLWAFSINKTLFSAINGAQHMATFAGLQALRYLLLLACFAGFVVWDVNSVYLAGVFSIAELLLMPILLFFSNRVVGRWSFEGLRQGLKQHASFGGRVFLSGAMMELNTRVDVLMIAFFIDAAASGIYSVAALVAEGAGQAIFAVRNNFNPIIGRMVARREFSELFRLSRRSALLFTPFMVAVSLIAWAAYPMFSRIAFNNDNFLAAGVPLVILLSGLTLSGAFMIFSMIFTQAGRPAVHTGFVMTNLLVNISLNLALIPSFGIEGAAFATALSYIISSLMLVFLSRAVLGVRLVF
ncbi:MAG TPA: polysaccharide biosynthesis C-terminal domain-containing protein [Hyphomonas sp.]|nr:polysaccharide biosynthesis C-terminal domain-containing protein [Hyphomonas sp.]